MKRYLWLSIFAVAMAFLEAAVVVYLRALYYPNGFEFPIVWASLDIAVVELGRELATVLMLLGVCALSGRDRMESFLHFCYVFGVWDIFYYVWLKACLGWPASLLTWDILFLLPLPWLGPVLAPVLVAVCLIAGSVLLLRRRARGEPLEIPRWAWALEIVAGLIVIASFTWSFRVVLEQTVPESFNWPLYWTGMALGIGVFGVTMARLSGRAASSGRGS